MLSVNTRRQACDCSLHPFSMCLKNITHAITEGKQAIQVPRINTTQSRFQRLFPLFTLLMPATFPFRRRCVVFLKWETSLLPFSYLLQCLKGTVSKKLILSQA